MLGHGGEDLGIWDSERWSTQGCPWDGPLLLIIVQTLSEHRDLKL